MRGCVGEGRWVGGGGAIHLVVLKMTFFLKILSPSVKLQIPNFHFQRY